MQKRGVLRYFKLLALVIVLAFSSSSIVGALDANSDSYQLSEVQFGGSTNFNGCSDDYCAEVSIGDMTSGTSSSSSYGVEFGQILEDEPSLEVIVIPGESNLGILSAENTATKTAIIKVRSYLSGGYILRVTGDSPKFGTHNLKTPAIPTASVPGLEQFGINIVANSSPSVGSNPIQAPGSGIELGKASGNYSLENMFMYLSGDTVAYSDTDSSQTDYTLSMIVNISNSTPAGHYFGDYAVVVIPAF
jgi:hypothetical protein